MLISVNREEAHRTGCTRGFPTGPNWTLIGPEASGGGAVQAVSGARCPGADGGQHDCELKAAGVKPQRHEDGRGQVGRAETVAGPDRSGLNQ